MVRDIFDPAPSILTVPVAPETSPAVKVPAVSVNVPPFVMLSVSLELLSLPIVTVLPAVMAPFAVAVTVLVPAPWVKPPLKLNALPGPVTVMLAFDVALPPCTLLLVDEPLAPLSTSTVPCVPASPLILNPPKVPTAPLLSVRLPSPLAPTTMPPVMVAVEPMPSRSMVPLLPAL